MESGALGKRALSQQGVKMRKSYWLALLLCCFLMDGRSLFAQDPIDLSHWNLTLPIGKADDPDVIPTAQLVAGYRSQYFYREKDGGQIFWCPVTGVTTKGTHYPRTELRETSTNGKLRNWHLTDGTAELKAETAVLQVPGTGRLTIGQIHDDAHEIKSQPLLKLLYEYSRATGTGTLVAQIRSTPEAANDTNHIVLRGLKLGERLTYRIELRPDGTLKIDINGSEAYSEKIDESWNAQELYFKAGSYLEDNQGTPKDGGRVEFYALKIKHE
jgi:hypothetical protein